MAFRIAPHVIWGEINNTRRNQVFGRLVLASGDPATQPQEQCERLVTLSLTGNLGGELEGRRFRFVPRESGNDARQEPADAGFCTDQAGVMGDAVLREVRVPLAPLKEFLAARKRGEQPPETVQPSLYLEWYSQNGRVVLEMVNPILEFEGAFDQLADPEPEPLPEVSPDAISGPSITIFRRSENGDDVEVEHVGGDLESDEGEVGEDDPWGLFPDGDPLEDPGPSAPRPWDEVIPGLDPETKAHYEQWDEITHGTMDEPLGWLLEGPLKLPRPENVFDETEAWSALNSLLTALALRGVAFDMCEHFSAVQAYRLLMTEILPEAQIHPRLVKTGFVRHYCSWEHCADCEAEFEAEYQRRSKQG